MFAVNACPSKSHWRSHLFNIHLLIIFSPFIIIIITFPFHYSNMLACLLTIVKLFQSVFTLWIILLSHCTKAINLVFLSLPPLFSHAYFTNKSKISGIKKDSGKTYRGMVTMMRTVYSVMVTRDEKDAYQIFFGVLATTKEHLSIWKQ